MNAKIGYWFNINPFVLNSEEKLGLLLNLDTMQAQDRIERGDYDSEDWKGVYWLFKVAYDDEEMARQAQSQALEKYVDRCVKK